MNTFFWLSFFFASPPHDTACATRGTPLLEIRERSETSTALTTKRIYASGAWTFKNEQSTARGCFSRKELRAIRRAVQRAPWQITKSPIACFAYDPHFTEFVMNGRLRYTHRLCSGRSADPTTLAALDLVQQELAEALPSLPLPPPTPPTPIRPEPRPTAPTCSTDGAPLFEIRKRSEAQEPTSTTTIYGSGAWTFQPVDKDGRAGALATGCFDKRTLAALRTEVRDAPWQVTTSQFTCRAYAPSFTEYHVAGRPTYTARLCGAQRIDARSAGAIERVEAELASVVPALHGRPAL